MRERLRKVIEINRHAFDFENMLWSLTSPLIHVSEKTDTVEIYQKIKTAGYFGFFLSTVLGSVLLLPEISQHWLAAYLLWTVGALWVCFFGGGDLYITWLVWKKSRKIGRPMEVFELNNKAT